MERSSKLIVVGWTLAALALDVLLLVRGWGQLVPLSAAVFVAAAVAVAVDRRAIAAVLVWACVFPVAIRILADGYSPQFDLLWMAAIVGAIVPDALRRPWQIPAAWRAPLVCGVGIVSVSAPLVCWRELDFTLSLLSADALSNSVVGGSPSLTVSWTLHVALVLVVGVLWFDWLCGLPDLAWCRRWVFAPLGISALVMMAVAIYQLFGNVLFLNETAYGAMGRASGTVFDGNVCGMAAALSMGGMSLTAQHARRLRALYTCAGLAVGWLAVWATGSRTSLAVALVVTASTAWVLVASAWAAATSSRTSNPAVRIGVAAIVVVLVALGAGLTVGRSGSTVVGPLQRLRAVAPRLSPDGVARFASLMWNRDQYGTVSTRMIREFPWSGVGVGGFHVMAPDYGALIGLSYRLPPDNAQNWVRHQTAELGVIGGLAWALWMLAFGWTVLRGGPALPSSSLIIRGTLLAFGLVSMVGMPGQEILIAILLWTLIYWYGSLAAAIPRAPVPLTWPVWGIIVAAIAAQAVATQAAAHGNLRVPARAARIGWPYQYGLYDPEPDPLGRTTRWTSQHAVAVIDVPAPWLELSTAFEHRNAAEQPADGTVSVDGRVILAQRFATTAPITRVVRVPDGRRRLVLESRVSRTERPRDAGAADDRDLGLRLSWRFLAQPPSEQSAQVSR